MGLEEDLREILKRLLIIRQVGLSVIMELSDTSHNTGREGPDFTPVAKAMAREPNFSESSLRFRMRWIEGFCSGRAIEQMRISGPSDYFLYLDSLKAWTLEPWQQQQAEETLWWFLRRYLKVEDLEAFESRRHSAPYRGWKEALGALVEEIRVKQYAMKTEKAYLSWAERFARFCGEREPREVKGSDVKDFLSHLAIDAQVAASTQNQALCALVFLFRHVLKIEMGDLAGTLRAKPRVKVPVALTLDEVRKLFAALEGTPLLMCKLMYGSGLRVSEVCRLRVSDLDFAERVLTVRGGKGNKDRRTVLPKNVLPALSDHLERVRGLHAEDLEKGHGSVYLPPAMARKYSQACKEWVWQYVFPSKKLCVDPRSGIVRRHHVFDKAVQRFVKKAARDADLTKVVTPHVLRHSLLFSASLR